MMAALEGEDFWVHPAPKMLRVVEAARGLISRLLARPQTP